MTLKVVDLFSGIGGFSYGLEQTGHFKTVGFCEKENYCKKVLAKNFPDIPITSLVEDLKIPDDVDVLCGGFPCQNISIGGNREGLDGDESKLWFEYLRQIREYRPRYAIIENVYGLLSSGFGTILQNLAEIGYDASWTTLDTKFFGLSQRRRRVFIIAVRDGIPDGADIFSNIQRSSEECRQKIHDFEESHYRDFCERQNISEEASFYTCQRSDEYDECGLASTIKKRDYKMFTDIIVQNGIARRMTPEERMVLQGLPIDWLDVDISMTDKYKCNGMSVPVVKFVGECLNGFHVQYG